MDPKAQTALERDEAAIDELAAAIEAHQEERALDTHTCLPGYIVSFDPDTQTAKVQPGIQRIFAQQGPVNLPELVDVPVCFPGGGPFVLTFPIAKNDECILVFSERAIDFWFQNGAKDGEAQLPAEYRTHDLSDAFAFVGVNSRPRKLSGVSTSDVQLRSRDGDAFVSIDPDKNITAQTTTGKVILNVPGGSSACVQAVTGVLTGMDPCPIMGMTHGSFGGGAARVHAGKT